MADQVTVIGADRLRATARVAGARLDHIEAPDAGSLVASRGRAGAPKVTGRLASSVRPGTEHGDVIVSSRLVYAGVIHNGWPGHNITANPFLARALENSKGAVTRAYVVEAQSILGHVKGA